MTRHRLHGTKERSDSLRHCNRSTISSHQMRRSMHPLTGCSKVLWLTLSRTWARSLCFAESQAHRFARKTISRLKSQSDAWELSKHRRSVSFEVRQVGSACVSAKNCRCNYNKYVAPRSSFTLVEPGLRWQDAGIQNNSRAAPAEGPEPPGIFSPISAGSG